MEEQDLQWEGGYQNEERIADILSHYSLVSRVAAQMMALQDQAAVEKELAKQRKIVHISADEDCEVRICNAFSRKGSLRKMAGTRCLTMESNQMNSLTDVML